MQKRKRKKKGSKNACTPYHRSKGILKPSCASCTGIPSLYANNQRKTENMSFQCHDILQISTL